eukprot:10666870-Alexandrium_andersonii.AAC.1
MGSGGVGGPGRRRPGSGPRLRQVSSSALTVARGDRFKGSLSARNALRLSRARFPRRAGPVGPGSSESRFTVGRAWRGHSTADLGGAGRPCPQGQTDPGTR